MRKQLLPLLLLILFSFSTVLRELASAEAAAGTWLYDDETAPVLGGWQLSPNVLVLHYLDESATTTISLAELSQHG